MTDPRSGGPRPHPSMEMSEVALGHRTALPLSVTRSVPVAVPAARVLHVNDCAFTAHNLLVEAHERGLPWGFMPLAASGARWHGPVAQVRRATLGAAWLTRLSIRATRADLLHVHFATVYQHTRFVPRPYVLHCHGTDVRTLQYDDRYRSTVTTALLRARAVLYSTPDLAEHVLSLRPDATYLPVPIDVDALPVWRAPTTTTTTPRTTTTTTEPEPAGERHQRTHEQQEQQGPRTVLFASRWDDSKGLDTQLGVARDLVGSLGPDVRVLGLDWGPAAGAARDHGVRLLPRTDHASYLGLLAGADVVLGQSAGILAASELEALAIGAPLVLPVPLPLYASVRPPVLGGSADDAVAVVQGLLDGTTRHDPQEGRTWVRRHHGIARAVDTTIAVYASALGS